MCLLMQALSITYKVFLPPQRKKIKNERQYIIEIKPDQASKPNVN